MKTQINLFDSKVSPANKTKGFKLFEKRQDVQYAVEPSNVVWENLAVK